MAPTKEQVLDQVKQISVFAPEYIYSWEEMCLLVMRSLRSSSKYVSKVLNELVEDGEVKKLRVAPQGYLYLDDEDKKFPGMGAPYMHVDKYSRPSRGRVSMEFHSGGSYWAGDLDRPYVISTTMWGHLLDKLEAEARKKAAQDKEKREVENSLHEAYLEEKVPGYKEVRDALGVLFPGIEVQPHVIRPEKNPRVLFHVETIKMSDLVRLVDVLKRGLEAS